MIGEQYLEGYIILRQGLVDGVVYPDLGKRIGRFLGHTLFFTSDFYMDTASKKALVGVYSANVLAGITEKVVFTDPYYPAPLNRHTTPQLDDTVSKIQSSSKLKVKINALRYKFQNATEALIHGDLHTGSIMVVEDKMAVIDAEFSFVGPMGFDIGAIIGNLLLSFYSQESHGLEKNQVKERGEYKNYLETCISQAWDTFSTTFKELAMTHINDNPDPFWSDIEAYKTRISSFLKMVFNDTLNFAGAKMLRRILGVAHVQDFEAIKNNDTRAIGEEKALALAQVLILVEPGDINTCQQLLNKAKSIA